MSEAQKQLIPGVCRIDNVDMTNYAGESINLRQLVAEIRATESIHSMFCVYEFVIVDGTALLEKYAITGNEKIELTLSKKDNPEADDVITTKYLTVTGIKEYSKATNESQIFILQAVSETALHSSIQRTSKAVNGSVAKILPTLYNEVNYQLPLEIVDNNTEGNFQLVLPNYTYTNIFAMLINKAQNSSGSTFHMFESLWGDIQFTSYDEMIARENVDTYRMIQGESQENAQQPSSFDKVRTKIKSINSNIGASHYESFKNGGISSRVFTADVATKSFTKVDRFLLDENLAKMEPDYILSDTYTVAGKPVSDMKQAKTIMVNKNSLAFSNSDNGSNKKDESVALKKFKFENQFAVGHNITVVGDSRLQAGNCVEVVLPTPTDPKFIDENRDEYFSGKYLVTSVRHTIFMGGAYTLDLTIRKDSVDRTLMTTKYKDIK